MPEQDDIRLGLRVRQDRQGILRPEDRAAAQASDQQLVQTRDTRRVAAADHHLVDDLPSDQLDPVVLIEDSGPSHLVVLVHREAPPDYLDLRRHTVMVRAPGAGASMPNVGYAGRRRVAPVGEGCSPPSRAPLTAHRNRRCFRSFLASS